MKISVIGKNFCIVCNSHVIRFRYLVLKKTKIDSVLPDVCMNQEYRKEVEYRKSLKARLE
jgi:hypothetical protein